MTVSWPDIAAHRERLVRVARRRVPTREDAEDVVHEAMLRCATFENLDEARLGQFLTAVTLRLCADLYRHQERATRASRRLVERDEVPSPEELACEAAEAEEIHALLATLPERQRDVLVERALGLSVSQISTRHALTYKATESALSRARSTMRVALAAAMSFLGAVVATIRRRPSVVLAVPLTALAVVTSTFRAPYGGDPREIVIGAPSSSPDDIRDEVRVPVAVVAVRAATERIAPAPAAQAVHRPAPVLRAEHDVVKLSPAPGWSYRLYHDDEPTTSKIVRCARYGYDLIIVIEPGERYDLVSNCGSAPSEKE